MNNGAGYELTQMAVMPGWGRRPSSLDESMAVYHHGGDSCHKDVCHDCRHQPSWTIGDRVISKDQLR
jgi:hypothetical protein